MSDQISDEFNLFDNEDLLFYNDGTKNNVRSVNLSENSVAFSETYYGSLNIQNFEQHININSEEYVDFSNFTSDINNAMYENNESVSKSSLNAQLYFNDHVISASSSYRFLRRGPTTKICEFCGLFLRHPSKIAAHMRTHTGERPFVCEYCGQDFSQRTPYRMHVKRHVGDLPFNCSCCDKKFPNNASRNGHEIRVHHKFKKQENSQPNLKSTQSLINKSGVNVTKKCSSIVNLQSPVENLKKPITDIAMRRISNIVEFVAAGIHENIVIPSSTTKVHQSLHSIRRCENRHPPTIAQCADCGLIFKHPSKIQAHMRTHTGEKPFRCAECGLGCSTNSALRVHIRRFHTGERPHECTWECGKRFVSVSARNEHERIVHAGIKRYQCAIGDCRRLFTRRSYMVKHLQTHSSSVVELLHQKRPITASFKRLQNERNILGLEV